MFSNNHQYNNPFRHRFVYVTCEPNRHPINGPELTHILTQFEDPDEQPTEELPAPPYIPPR